MSTRLPERREWVAPAPVVLPRLPRYEVLTGTRNELLAELRRGSKRAEYDEVSELKPFGDRYTYAVRVHRIREAPPRWRRPVLIAGGIAIGLAGIALAGWLVISAIVGAATAAGLGWLAGMALMAGAGWVLRRQVVEVIVRVSR